MRHVRRQKDHPRKLQNTHSKLKHDSGIKHPKHARDQSIICLQKAKYCAQASNDIKKIAVSPELLHDYRPDLSWRRRLKRTKATEKRNEHPLHQRQMEIGTGLIVNKSMPNKQENRGISALLIKSHKRCLSRGDHSCSELLRNATTTPANPASATAISAALERASHGSIAFRLNRT
jgi:hypothetical protein